MTTQSTHASEKPVPTSIPSDRSWSDRFANLGRRFLPYALIVGLIVLFSAKNKLFLTSDNMFNILRSSATLMVVACGATLIIVAGSIDLSVGAVAALTGTIAVYFSAEGHPWWMVLALPIGAACGLLNGTLVAYAKLPSFLTTLGTLFILGGLALRITGGASQQMNAPILDNLINSSTILNIPNNVWWAVIVFVITAVIAYRTPFGRHVYAVGGNERVARLSGLRIERTKLLLFGFSGLLAGVAGLMLVGQGGGSSPGMGDPFLLNSIAAVVMGGTALSGGTGGPARTILGVLTLGIVTNGMVLSQVDPNYQTVVFGIIVLFAVIVSVRRSETTVVK
jgi:ribose transport system permease protein